MNKKDFKLIAVILVVIIILFLIFFLIKDKGDKQALVYYEDKLVLTIDLSVKEEREYLVNGYNGDVIIVSKDGKVKVKQENSPKHLCSNQGYISESYETIVCLPNKIVINIEGKKDIDTVVR